MKLNQISIKLLFTFNLLIACNSAFALCSGIFPDNKFNIAAVNWHTGGFKKHWWSLTTNAYEIVVNSEAASDANPQQIYKHNKTFSTIFLTTLSYSKLNCWSIYRDYCYKEITGKIKPDNNGIVHAKLFITVKRKNFNTNKPEIVYLDIKNNKTAKITWLSENNWYTEYNKFAKDINYRLHDNDSNENKK